MSKTPWNDWAETEEGKQALDYSTLTGETYLRNRLWRAHRAGTDLAEAENQRLREALAEAAEFADIADLHRCDWNLDRVQIGGKWVKTADFAEHLRECSQPQALKQETKEAKRWRCRCGREHKLDGTLEATICRHCADSMRDQAQEGKSDTTGRAISPQPKKETL